MAWRITVQSRCLELNGQAQEGNSLSDRAPALNFSLTCESLSTWIFFMMTEDHKDTTQLTLLYFTREAKPVQTLRSQIQNTSRSLRKPTLSARSGGLYCFCVTKKGIGTFIFLLHFPPLCLSVLGEPRSKKQRRHIYQDQHISRATTALHSHF